MKQVLVTGAGGFVGSHLCAALVRAGWQVQAFIHAPSGPDRLLHLPPEIQAELELIPGNIRDAAQLRRIVQDQTLIVHLVNLQVPDTLMYSHAFIETHVTGTLNLLHAALSRDCRVLHASVAEVYGAPLHVPVDEKHPLQGRSPYLASKIAADMLAESFVRSFRLNLTLVRLFPLCGRGQHAGAPVPWLLRQLQDPATEHLILPPYTLDLSPVSDAIGALMAVAACPKPLAGEVLNIGSGQPLRLADLAHQLMTLLERDLPLREAIDCSVPFRLFDNLICDTTKLERLCGWQPSGQLLTALSESLTESACPEAA
jgi:nucleoside-diphosphate-sugar epimerase